MDKLSIPSMLCMYGSRCFSQDDPRWSDMTILYAMWYDAMALAYKLLCSLFFFCLKAFFSMATFAQCTNQDSNCVYAGTNLRHTRWYDTNMIWYVCNGRCSSLMCTSNVADNTQMASLDRQVTQNGLGVINAICKGNVQWCRRGYRPLRWWVAVLLMKIPRWWRLVPK